MTLSHSGLLFWTTLYTSEKRIWQVWQTDSQHRLCMGHKS